CLCLPSVTIQKPKPAQAGFFLPFSYIRASGSKKKVPLGAKLANVLERRLCHPPAALFAPRAYEQTDQIGANLRLLQGWARTYRKKASPVGRGHLLHRRNPAVHRRLGLALCTGRKPDLLPFDPER